jgi:hypothetical protein
MLSIREKYSQSFAEQFVVRALSSQNKKIILDLVWKDINKDFIFNVFQFHPFEDSNLITGISTIEQLSIRMNNIDNFLVDNLSYLIVDYLNDLSDNDWISFVSIYSSDELNKLSTKIKLSLSSDNSSL